MWVCGINSVPSEFLEMFFKKNLNEILAVLILMRGIVRTSNITDCTVAVV